MKDEIGSDRMGPKTAVGKLPFRAAASAHQIVTGTAPGDGTLWKEPEKCECGEKAAKTLHRLMDYPVTAGWRTT